MHKVPTRKVGKFCTLFYKGAYAAHAPGNARSGNVTCHGSNCFNSSRVFSVGMTSKVLVQISEKTK